jgi:hypothetical protein
MLDRLRASFVYIVAFLLPLAGVLLAAARFVEQDREAGTRLAAVSLLGASIYLLVFLG